MEISFIELITAIYKKVKGEKNQELKDIRKFLKSVVALCTELVEIEDHRSDKASLIHEQLKEIYSSGTKKMRKLSTAKLEDEKEIFFSAIAHARMYYWLKIFEKGKDSAWFKAFAEGKKIPVEGSPSMNGLLMLLNDIRESDLRAAIGAALPNPPAARRFRVLRDRHLRTAKKVCLHAIAQLHNVTREV